LFLQRRFVLFQFLFSRSIMFINELSLFGADGIHIGQDGQGIEKDDRFFLRSFENWIFSSRLFFQSKGG